MNPSVGIFLTTFCWLAALTLLVFTPLKVWKNYKLPTFLAIFFALLGWLLVRDISLPASTHSTSSVSSFVSAREGYRKMFTGLPADESEIKTPGVYWALASIMDIRGKTNYKAVLEEMKVENGIVVDRTGNSRFFNLSRPVGQGLLYKISKDGSNLVFEVIGNIPSIKLEKTSPPEPKGKFIL